MSARAGRGTLALGLIAAWRLSAVCGLANGLIVTFGRIEPFIVTLGTMGIFRSLVIWLAAGGTITMRNLELRELYRPVYFGNVVGVPIPIIVFVIVAAVGALILYKTPFGRHVVALGSNEDVARYSGVPIGRVRTLAYVIQGLCVGIAVLVYVPRLGSATPTTGLLWELQAITAVVDRRHGAAGRRRAHLGHGRRRHHPGTRRQHHGAVELRLRISGRRGPGRHHHRRHARAALVCIAGGDSHCQRSCSRRRRMNDEAGPSPPAVRGARSNPGRKKHETDGMKIAAAAGLMAGLADAARWRSRRTSRSAFRFRPRPWLDRRRGLHAQETAKLLEKSYPGLKVIVKTSPDGASQANALDDLTARKSTRSWFCPSTRTSSPTRSAR